jgi:signal peptidase II
MSRQGTITGLRIGLVLAALTLILDQASKYYIFNVLRLPETGPIAILPILDFSFVWNRGISLGLFQQGQEFGRWVLVLLELAAAAFIFLWMARTRSLLTVVALGLIAGGAVGNAIDRALFGAVLDFLHLHGGTVRWLDFPYIFNVADTGISVGVALLVLETLFAKSETKSEAKGGALEPKGDSR